MKTYIWPASSINTAGLATEAKQDVIIAEVQDLNADNTSQNAAQLAETQDFHADNSSENAALLAEVQDFHTDNTTENQAIETAVNDVEAELVTLNATDFATAAAQATQTTELQGINAKLGAAFFTLPFDTLQVLSKTADGPTQIVSRTGGLGGTVVQTLDLVYDVDGDFESGVVS